jgi:putative membrane protein
VNAVAQAFAVLSALVFIWAGILESFFFHRPGVHEKIFHTRTQDVPAIRLWSFCQGFYNLFVAAGAIGGVIALHTGHDAAGRALVLYACAFMFGTGIVLGIADRRHLDGALGSSLPPLVALMAASV